MKSESVITINLKLIICKIIGHNVYEARCRGEHFGYQCIRCGIRIPFWFGKIKYPDFKNIVKDCKTKINSKFSSYGNSWVNQSDQDFWKRRLNDEIKEIWSAKTSVDMIKEIDDAINVLAMIRENAKEIHYPEDLQITSTTRGNGKN